MVLCIFIHCLYFLQPTSTSLPALCRICKQLFLSAKCVFIHLVLLLASSVKLSTSPGSRLIFFLPHGYPGSWCWGFHGSVEWSLCDVLSSATSGNLEKQKLLELHTYIYTGVNWIQTRIFSQAHISEL